MSTALYDGKIEKKAGPVIHFRLTMTHPDESRFGTDRVFAWKLLSDWVSPPDDGDDRTQAERHVRRVVLSPLQGAKVDKKGPNWFSVKRQGRKHPSVVYQIEVKDPALLADLKVGQSDEVYQFVEDGPPLENEKSLPAGKKKKGARDPGPAAAKPDAGPAAKAAPALEPKTYDDFRKETFTLLQRHPQSWLDFASGFIARWSLDESDEQVMAWLQALPAPEQGYTSQAAALVAVERARAGQLPSAKAFLALAEKKRPTEEWGELNALEGLVPAWWRLGQAPKAAAASAKLRAAAEKNQTDHNQLFHTLFSMAALGGALAEAKALIPECFKDGTYRSDLAVPGCVSLFADKEDALLVALLERWQVHEAYGDEEVTFGLFDRAISEGKPERFLEAFLRTPKLLNGSRAEAVALARAEQKSAKLGVTWATKLLDCAELYSDVRPRAVATLGAHAPAEAARWGKKNLPAIKGLEKYAFLAALGRDEEARGVLKAAQSADRNGLDELELVASVTMDRELARDALKLRLTRTRFDDLPASVLVQLVELGEQALVDAALEKALAAIEKLPAKDRDLQCRRFATSAGSVGRADLGLAAWKLPTNSVRFCTANDLVRGCASVGDWAGAFAALQKVPDDDSNGRVSTAVQAGVKTAMRVSMRSPRAVPMRCVAWSGGSQSAD